MVSVSWFSNLPKTRIFRKYLRSILSVTFIPLAGVIIAAFIVASIMALKGTFDTLRSITNERVRLVQLYANGNINNAGLIAGKIDTVASIKRLSRALRSGRKSSRYAEAYSVYSAYFSNLMAADEFSDAVLIGADGTLLAAKSLEQDIGQNLVAGHLEGSPLSRAFFEVKSGSKPVITLYHYHEHLNNYAMYVVAPITENGVFLGALAAQLVSRGLDSITLDNKEIGKSGEVVTGIRVGDEILFINPLGRDRQAAFTRRLKIGDSSGTPIQKAASGMNGMGITLDYSKVPVAAVWRYIPEMKWGMVVKRDLVEILLPLAGLLAIFVLLGAAAFLLAVVTAAKISGDVTKPIMSIIKASGMAAAGDLSVTAESSTGDELDDMAHNFNTMVAAHRAKVKELDDINSRLTAQSLKLEKYLDVSEALVVELDNDGRVVEINEKVRDLLGYSPDELIGSDWIEMTIPPGQRPKVKDVFGNVVNGTNERSEYNENEITAKDGTTRTIYWHNTNILGSDGRVAGTLSSGIDVTGLRQLETRLATSEERYRATFEQAAVGMVHSSPEGRLMRVNSEFCRITGYTDRELIGKAFVEITHPEDARRDFDMVMKAGRGEINDYAAEKRYIRKDGAVVWARLHVTPIREQGRLVYFVAVVEDITARKEAEASLRRSEKRFRQVFEQSSAGMVNATLKGVIQEANGAFCRIVGYEPAELAGMGFRKITPEQYVGPELLMLKEVVEGIKQAYTFEKEYMRKDGSMVWVRLTVTGIRNEDDRVTQLFAVVEDISARKRAEQELGSAMEALKISNAELEQFAFVASHDLQEPLRSITGYLQLIERKYRGRLDTDAESYIDAAVGAAVRMKDLINDVLEFSRIGRGNGRFERIEAGEALASALFMLKDAVERTGTVVESKPLPAIYGDMKLMTRLFQNLIGNAIKFCRASRPEIKIECTETDDEALFSVADNGIGIDRQYFDKIFLIFQRLHGRQEYPGTGIGLAVCKKIVERHGGRIWVESEQGKGSTFFFTVHKRGHE